MIAIDQCSWDRPGHSPFAGDIPAAVAHYTEIPPSVRLQLRERMQRHEFDDVVEIRRDSITGTHSYTDLRSMHFGNRLCKKVSRANWSDAAIERALIYCESDYCVAVPSICSNVSLVTRLPPPERAIPPAPPVDLPPGELTLEPPEDILPPLIAPPPSIDLTPPPETFEGPAQPPTWWPPVYAYAPMTPAIVAPPSIPPCQPIPEPSTWAMIVAGVVSIAARRKFSG